MCWTWTERGTPFSLRSTARRPGAIPTNVFSRLVLSGNTLFDDDDEFAARLIAPGDVKELAAALEDLTWEDVRGRFSVSDMLDQNIYPVTEEEKRGRVLRLRVELSFRHERLF